MLVLAPAAGPHAVSAEDRPLLEPIAEPVLDRLEPPARARLRAERQRVLGLAAGETPPSSLALAFGELGRLYHAHELLDPARGCYANAERLAPSDPRWPYLRGQLERQAARPEAAAPAFERALALTPDDVPALVGAARSSRDLGRLEEAERVARRALRIDPRAAGALLLLAALAGDRGDRAGAAQLYERLLALQPQATKLHVPLALAYRALGQEERARAHLAQRGAGTVTVEDPLLLALEALRTGAQPDVAAGQAAFERGDFVAAEQAFRRAVEAEPGHVAARVNLAAALVRGGRLEEGVARYREAVALDPRDAGARYGLGTALAQQGDDEGAVAEYAEALRLEPARTDARFNRANALRRLGRREDALAGYQEIVKADPGNVGGRVGEAVTLIELGRHAEARQRLKAGLAALPQSTALANVAARLLAASPDAGARDGTQALGLARRLVTIQRSVAHLETLAMALAETGDFAAAVQAQESVVAAAENAGLSGVLARARENLARYRRGEPCRDPAP